MVSKLMFHLQNYDSMTFDGSIFGKLTSLIIITADE